MSAFTELAAYPVVIELPVFWGDQDAFGHANNAVYFRWLESARIAYLERVAMAEKRAADAIGPILAAITCNYRRQVKYPDTMVVGTRITRIGRTSLTMDQQIWSCSHRALVADSGSTVVIFDYQAERSSPVPAALRDAISQLEGQSL